MNTGWLVVALGAVVLGIGGYVAYLAWRRRKLERRIDEFRSGSASDSTEQRRAAG